ncbi:CLAVATA3/ESR-related 2 [Euphorbia peplus]|nr:CLAVATA3/ESR-related 2 [Euphorbia peplus]
MPNSMRLSAFLVLVLLLLLFTTCQCRPVNSNVMVKKRRLRELYEVLNAFVEDAKQTGYPYPDRVSPGGPDPQHHARNG